MKLHTLTITILSSFSIAHSFSPSSRSRSLLNDSRIVLQLSQQPPNWGNYGGINPIANENDSGSDDALSSENNDDNLAKGNRWSKFAPDTSLPTDEFRAQLRENMKADLERRRREDPNRGNQPARSYLDSL